MSRARVMAVAVAVVGAASLMWAPGAASAASTTGCQKGFGEPGPVLFGDSLSLPRIKTGLNTGVYTVPELQDLFSVIDANGDHLICLKAVSNLQGNSVKAHEAFYGAIDNRHP